MEVRKHFSSRLEEILTRGHSREFSKVEIRRVFECRNRVRSQREPKVGGSLRASYPQLGEDLFWSFAMSYELRLARSHEMRPLLVVCVAWNGGIKQEELLPGTHTNFR